METTAFATREETKVISSLLKQLNEMGLAIKYPDHTLIIVNNKNTSRKGFKLFFDLISLLSNHNGSLITDKIQISYHQTYDTGLPYVRLEEYVELSEEEELMLQDIKNKIASKIEARVQKTVESVNSRDWSFRI